MVVKERARNSRVLRCGLGLVFVALAMVRDALKKEGREENQQRVDGGEFVVVIVA